MPAHQSAAGLEFERPDNALTMFTLTETGEGRRVAGLRDAGHRTGLVRGRR